MNHPSIFKFGELLVIPGVAALANSKDGAAVKSFKTLELVAYGTFTDY